MRRCSRSQSSCFPRCPPGPDRCLDLCRRSGTLVPRIARRRRNPPCRSTPTSRKPLFAAKVLHPTLKPTPGHESAHIAFYDERTALFFSGDFVLAGRLTIEDTAAEKRSAARVIAFLANRAVAHVLGGHIERDTAGHTYAEGATYHPNERALELSRQDLVKLPSALASFNGFYASHENYSITQPMHNLLAVLCAAFVLLSVLAFALYRLLLGWRRRRCRLASS